MKALSIAHRLPVQQSADVAPFLRSSQRHYNLNRVSLRSVLLKRYQTVTAAASTPSTMRNPKPILYDYPLAFNPAKARLIVEEKNFPVALTLIDIFNGQSLAPSFLKINPKSTVPSLNDGGHIISESKEIIKHIDNKGEPLGDAKVDRAAVNEWLDLVDQWDGNLFAAANAGSGFKTLFSTMQSYKKRYAQARIRSNPELQDVYEKKIAAMDQQIREAEDSQAVQENKALLNQILDKAEATLTKSAYLAGDAYSAADVIITPVLYRICMLQKQKEYLDPHPKVKAYYYEIIKQRPSFNKVFGPSDSPLTAARLVLPALAKAKFCELTGWY